jgi:hypothetical protein
VPLTNCYITLNEMREHSTIPDVNDDATLEPAITAACRAIDDHCGRFFYDAGSATPRTFRPIDYYTAHVWDFHTTTGLVVKIDDDDDGVYETTIAATEYELIEAPGPIQVARPYGVIRLVEGDLFPIHGHRRNVLEVTARWGWASTPDVVKQAARILALDVWKRKDAPFGVTGTVDFGPLRIGRDVFAGVSALLQPYRRPEFTVGLA